MLNTDQETASRIIDGKPASAKTFSPVPYDDLATYGNWGQDQNNATRVHQPHPRLVHSLSGVLRRQYSDDRYPDDWDLLLVTRYEHRRCSSTSLYCAPHTNAHR